MHILSQASTFEQIDENITNFTSLMEKVCDPLFSRNLQSTSNFDNDQPPKQTWFDDECRKFRKSFYLALGFL